MASETDALEMTSLLLSDTHKDKFDKVSELKETFESQKKWIKILMGRRFPMQLIPPENIVDMEVKSFVGLMKSCKWVNAIITENRSTFILKRNTITIDYKKIKENKRLLESYQYYHLKKIIFSDFENNVDDLLALLTSLNGTVSVTQVYLFNTVAIKELFLYLRPTLLTVTVRRLTPRSHCPIAAVTRDTIPGHLKEIDVVLDSPSTAELLENVISHFAGKSETLKIRVSLKEMSSDILYDRLEFCMKNLAICRRNQQIFFTCSSRKFLREELTIMKPFQAKAECSNLTSFPFQNFSRLFSFYKTEPGLVITLFGDIRERFMYHSANIMMSYCPTKQAVRDFASDFYSNDANNDDHDTLKSLKDKIEDHFSSNNVEDACYEPFENIEEDKFQLQPKQLEASELQLILDWKQRKPLPQLSWRLPVTEQVEQQLELLEEAVDIQMQWITFLRKRNFILNEIPRNCVLEILKRMDGKAFVRALRTCKEIKKIIDYIRPTFRKHVEQEFEISDYDIDNVDEWAARELECRSYFRFMRIEFSWFDDETAIPQAAVSKLAERNILCETLKLNDTALTQEMVESLRPRCISFYDENYSCPQNYPEHVIKVDLLIRGDDSWLIPAVEDLAGKHFQVEIRMWELGSEQEYQLIMQAFRCCIEKIKSRRGNGRFVFIYYNTSFCVQNVNHEEILQRHDYLSYVKSTKLGQTLILVTKVTGGVVAGIFCDRVQKFLWQFITTMEDFEKLFIDGTKENYKILGPEDEIAFSTIRAYFV